MSTSTIHLTINHLLRLHRWLSFTLVVALIGGGTSALQAQTKINKPNLPIKPAAAAEDTRPVGSIENEYLKVEVNSHGQFVIRTTGGDPNIEGDEDKTLLYDGLIGAPPGIWGTSFTTFRTLRTGGWAYGANNEHGYFADQVVSTDRIVSKWLMFSACEHYAAQTLSFMTNPFTKRKDMVKIEYRIGMADEDTHTICNPPFLGSHYGVRLLLDTMIGDNDEAPFFIPGLGNTSLQHDFSGDSVPPLFRVFESPTYERNSLQAIGYMLPETSLSHSKPDRLVIASWPDIYARDDHNAPFDDRWLWNYTAPADQPHEDSAVALYWSDRNRFSDTYFAFGYGLAPQGGGDSWVDIVQKAIISTSGCFLWVVNNTDQPYTGGVATLTLPPGLTLAGQTATAASLTTSQSFTQTIGDVAPGAVAQIGWRIEAIGGPGDYQFSTEAAFASGQTFSNTQTVTVQETVGFAQEHYIVDENAGVATITLMRTNPSSNALTVDFATTDGTAIAGSDYVATSGTLTFSSDEITKTLSIPLIDDSVREGNETVLLSLNNASGSVEVLEQDNVSLTIQDDELTPETGTTVFLPVVIR